MMDAITDQGEGSVPEEDEPLGSVTMMTTPGLWVRTPHSLRLVRLDFAVSDALDAVDRRERPSVPSPTATNYAVARSDYRVRTHVPDPWQHDFLTACGTAGASQPCASQPGAAISAAQVSDLDLTETRAALFTWLPLAADAGMVTVVPPTGQSGTPIGSPAAGPGPPSCPC